MTRPNPCLFSLLIAIAIGATHCAAAERLYVAFPNRIMTFDKAGALLNSFPVAGTLVRNIAVDSWGSIYAVGLFATSDGVLHSTVTKYDPTGNFLGVIASRDSSESHFLGLAIKNNDTLYVGLNSGFDAIERFSVTGTPLGTFATISTPVPGAPFDIVFDSGDNMYVPDATLIEKFNASGASLGSFASIPSVPTGNLIFDIAVSSDDYVYASALDDKIYHFNPMGVAQVIDPQIDIRSIAVDGDDVLFVAGGGSGNNVGQIKTFEANGTPTGIFATNLPGEPIDMEFVTVVPEPSSCILTVVGTLIPIYRRGRAK
jgi:hypothetical protein